MSDRFCKYTITAFACINANRQSQLSSIKRNPCDNYYRQFDI